MGGKVSTYEFGRNIQSLIVPFWSSGWKWIVGKTIQNITDTMSNKLHLKSHIIIFNFIKSIKYQITHGTITKVANINFPYVLTQKGVPGWVSAGSVSVAKRYCSHLAVVAWSVLREWSIMFTAIWKHGARESWFWIICGNTDSEWCRGTPPSCRSFTTLLPFQNLLTRIINTPANVRWVYIFKESNYQLKLGVRTLAGF